MGVVAQSRCRVSLRAAETMDAKGGPVKWDREIRVAPGRVLAATTVYDTYWRFAAKRQEVFMRRVAGLPPPWSDNPVLSAHRFTNVYRAADRVSQYLIRNVLYDGTKVAEEVFFRALLFKLFNRIETWEQLTARLGALSWKTLVRTLRACPRCDARPGEGGVFGRIHHALTVVRQ